MWVGLETKGKSEALLPGTKIREELIFSFHILTVKSKILIFLFGKMAGILGMRKILGSADSLVLA